MRERFAKKESSTESVCDSECVVDLVETGCTWQESVIFQIQYFTLSMTHHGLLHSAFSQSRCCHPVAFTKSYWLATMVNVLVTCSPVCYSRSM